jgi:hypothetical protein
MATKKYTAHALEVLRLVKAGRPFEGRTIAGRRKHLNWLEAEGLVREIPGGWQVTDAGDDLLLNTVT